MKKSDNDSNTPSAKRQYKKRYILRVYEEQEAKEEIVQYDSETDVDHSKRGADDWGHGKGVGT